MGETRVGKVIQVIGPVADVEFEPGNLPADFDPVERVDRIDDGVDRQAFRSRFVRKLGSTREKKGWILE